MVVTDDRKSSAQVTTNKSTIEAPPSSINGRLIWRSPRLRFVYHNGRLKTCLLDDEFRSFGNVTVTSIG